MSWDMSPEGATVHNHLSAFRAFLNLSFSVYAFVKILVFGVWIILVGLYREFSRRFVQTTQMDKKGLGVHIP